MKEFSITVLLAFWVVMFISWISATSRLDEIRSSEKDILTICEKDLPRTQHCVIEKRAVIKSNTL